MTQSIMFKYPNNQLCVQCVWEAYLLRSWKVIPMVQAWIFSNLQVQARRTWREGRNRGNENKKAWHSFSTMGSRANVHGFLTLCNDILVKYCHSWTNLNSFVECKCAWQVSSYTHKSLVSVEKDYFCIHVLSKQGQKQPINQCQCVFLVISNLVDMNEKWRWSP